jgi:glycosyltransferase involved in cell wall biosynthesis
VRILILSQWYPPEPMKLLSDMAETLTTLGHQVTVLTGFPNWPTGKIYPGYRVRLLKRERMWGVPIVRIPLYPDHGRSGIKRVLNFASFVVSALLLGPWVVPRPDVIHAIQPPTTCLAGWFLSRIWGVSFTYEVQDMWPETLFATGMVKGEKILAAVGAFCTWAYRKTAAIRVISRGFRNDLIRKGVNPEKIHYIPNWVDTDFYRPEPYDAVLADKLGLSGRFNIMYAGTVGLAQGLETLMDAAVLLGDLPRIQFVIVGDGVELPRLMKLREERKISNVKFLGRYPMEKMGALYSLTDVLLVHLKDDPLFRMTIPHKTLTYLAAGKPVLAAVEGDVADLIKEVGAGLSCPPMNPRALAGTVREFYNMPSVTRERLGQNGRSAARERFRRLGLVESIGAMLEISSRSVAGLPVNSQGDIE